MTGAARFLPPVLVLLSAAVFALVVEALRLVPLGSGATFHAAAASCLLYVAALFIAVRRTLPRLVGRGVKAAVVASASVCAGLAAFILIAHVP